MGDRWYTAGPSVTAKNSSKTYVGRIAGATNAVLTASRIDNKKKWPVCSTVATNEDLSEEIEQLVRRAEQDGRTHTFARLADLYRKTGEVERALEVVERGLKHHPHYLNARIVHARVLSELGRRMDARAAFERVLQIDSENLVAQAALAELGVDGPSTSALAPDDALTREEESAARRGAGWLARLDADWHETHGGNGDLRAETGPAVDGAAATPAAETPAAKTPAAEPRPVEEEAGPAAPEAPDAGEQELETATLAALYVRQGLFDRAIAIYERLLARDPYNARLASALEDARRRTDPHSEPFPAPPAVGPTSSAGRVIDERRSEEAQSSGPSAADAAPPTSPADAAPPAPATDGVHTMGALIEDILDGKGDAPPPSAPGRWPEWLVRLGREP